MAVNIKTGREDHEKAGIEKMMRTLEGQPDYVSGFYYYMRNSGKTASYKTHEIYVYIVTTFLKKINKDITDINMDDITKYLSQNSIKENGELASGTTLVLIYSALKKFFTYLKSSDKISKNPMEHIERPKPKPSDQVVRDYLTMDEIILLFSSLSTETIWNKRDKALLTVMFFTGVRNTAITEINVDNVDFDEGCIHVLDKGNKTRKCYLSNDKMNVIKDWVNERNKLELETNALFISTHRKRLEKTSAFRIIKKHTKNFLGHEVSPHKARASFATNALKSGVSLYEVSKLMNHSSTKVTSDCYIQGNDEMIREASQKAIKYITFD